MEYLSWSVSHRLFVEDEEALLTGFLLETPLDPADGSEARKAAYLPNADGSRRGAGRAQLRNRSGRLSLERMNRPSRSKDIKMFHRAGLRIIPLSYTLWRAQRDRWLQAIDEALSSGNGKA